MFYLKEYLNADFIGSTEYKTIDDCRMAIARIIASKQQVTIKVVKIYFDEKGYPIESLFFSSSFYEVEDE